MKSEMQVETKIETPLGPGKRSAGVDTVGFKTHAGVAGSIRTTPSEVTISLVGFPFLKMRPEFATRFAAALELAARTGTLEVMDEI